MTAFAGFLASWAPRLLSILRIMTGLLYLQHGSGKMLHFPYAQMYQGIQPYSLVWIAGILELVGSPLIILGLFTRAVAFLLSGEMAVAYFLYSAPQGFFPLLNKGELAVQFCFVFLYLSAAGGGPWSIDVILRRPHQQ
jgi:putative oxidoreductase